MQETTREDVDIRGLLLTLGLPTFGLAFAICILTTYGPVLLLDLAGSPGTVGALLAGEGALALAVPLVAGALSDRLPAGGRLGKRLPFVVVGGPLVLAGLVLLPLSVNLLVAGIALLLFFVGYYLYYPPYRALYADLLPRSQYARSQASQAVYRGAGLGLGLMTGGFFLGLWMPLPFVVAGSIVLASTLVLRPIARLQRTCEADGSDPVSLRVLLHDSGMRTFAVANSLLETGFAGLRTFIVLYVTEGLDRSTTVASAVIGVVAVAYVVGAPLASRLERRFDIVTVMSWAGVLYGVGLVAGMLPRTLTPELFLLPFVALAGSVLLTLPPALAFLVAPQGSEGVAAAVVEVSRGVGVVLGPLLVGYAVRFGHGVFPATEGYAAMWPVIGVATLLAVPLLRRLSVEP